MYSWAFSQKILRCVSFLVTARKPLTEGGKPPDKHAESIAAKPNGKSEKNAL